MDVQQNLQCTLEKEGFLGTFFPGTKYADKAIIFVGGSEEKRDFVEARAKLLAEEGFSVLSVGFYLWPPLSKDTVFIPVDYAERAVHWLKNNCPIKITSIGMTGLSLGAAYTLLCASLIPDISCVVSVSGFDFVVEGCKHMVVRQHKSYFSYHGKDIPYEKAEALSHLGSTLRAWKKNPNYGSKAMNRFYYNECFKDRTDTSRIKVENIQGDVLLLAPEFDDTWPSDEAFPRIMRKLEEVQFPYRYECVIYPEASHCLTMPEASLEKLGGETKMNRMLAHFMTMEAKYPEGCRKARAESWNKMVSFFKESFGVE